MNTRLPTCTYTPAKSTLLTFCATLHILNIITNMAANGELVLSDVLCFVKNKYVKVPGKPLKSALVEHFTLSSRYRKPKYVC